MGVSTFDETTRRNGSISRENIFLTPVSQVSQVGMSGGNGNRPWGMEYWRSIGLAKLFIQSVRSWEASISQGWPVFKRFTSGNCL